MKRALLTLLAVLAVVALVPAQQTGDPNRDYTINGFGAAGTSPIAQTVFAGVSNLDHAYATADPFAGMFVATGSAITPGWLSAGPNSIDVGPVGFELLVDPTRPGLLSSLFTTDNGGAFALTAGVPAGIGGSSLRLQVGHLSPTSASGFFVSQAHEVAVNVLPPQPLCGPNATDLGLGDDQSSVQSLATPFTFYGSTFNQISVWSNGNLSFDPAGGSGFTANPSAFLSTAGPDISPFATDLNPSQGGRVMFESTGAITQICWETVPEFFNNGSYTIRATLDSSAGIITLEYGLLSGQPTDVMVGITPGSNLSTGLTTDWTAGGGSTTNLNEAIYEYFDVFNAANPVDLTGATITIILDPTGSPTVWF